MIKEFIIKYLNDTNYNYRGLVSKFKNKTLLEKVNNLLKDKLNISKFSTSQKLYHILNDKYDNNQCKNIKCLNTTKYKNINLGYHPYCSCKCKNSCEEILTKIKDNNLINIGVDHHTQTPEYRLYVKTRNENKEFGVLSYNHKKLIKDKYN